MKKLQLQEVKSLRWLANMFPAIKEPKDELDRMNNAIHIYSTAGAKKLEELSEQVELLQAKLELKEPIDVTNDIITSRKFKVIALCGSNRFKKQFLEVKEKLFLEGNIVLSLDVFTQTDGETKTLSREMLDEMHKQKIDMSDEIYVINVGGYIGRSTMEEIAYAKSKGKIINYYRIGGKND